MHFDDDPNAIHAQALANVKNDGGQAGRSFTFQGKPLEPFSFTRRLAYNRMTLDRITQLEADTILVYLCTKSAKEADAARGEDGEANFRLKASEWVEGLPDQQNVTTAILDAAKAIRDDLDKAQSLEPDPKGQAPGNA